MGLLTRCFKFVLGTSIVTIAFAGFLPLIMGSGAVDSFTASTEEAPHTGEEKTSPSNHNSNSEALVQEDKEKQEAFHNYINKDSEQSKVHKERAKRLNGRKPNSFGFWGDLNESEQSLGAQYKKRF